MIQSSVNAHWLNTFRLNVLCYWVLHVATQTSSCRIPSSPYGSMMRPPLLRLPTRSIRYDWSCFWNEENLLALANTSTHLPVDREQRQPLKFKVQTLHMYRDVSGWLVAKLGELGVGLSEINANNDKLHHFHNELVEFKLLLEKAGDLFASARSYTARGSFAAGSTKS
ncbi:hypothetical protein DY000_02020271 [Brassica cretica]|uniref:Uncharacterized protein n=1 Tax=Brassica cretica TaxID=69181 RepID=A0ABQ7E8T6_BRACR|nr:hypothetical protein DY000_02020271 [Brassica cretica]